MAMVGSLALHTDNDQEDSDFFDQLANEFGDGDLVRLQSGLQQEEKERIDDSFSKLILGEEDCTPAPLTATSTHALVSASVAEDIDDNNSDGHDFWLKENDIEETAVKSESSNLAEAVLGTTSHPLVESSEVDAPLAAADGIHSSIYLHAEHNDRIETESLIVESQSPSLIENPTVVGAPAETVEHRLEPSGWKDVCPSESGTAELSFDFPSCILTAELDSTPVGNNESKEGPPLIRGMNGSGSFCEEVSYVANDHLQFEASTVNPLEASPVCTSVEPGLDGDTLEDSSQEITDQIGGYPVEPSIDLSADSERIHFPANATAEHVDEKAFWNQPGVFDYGISEHDNSSSANVPCFNEVPYTLESKQSGISAAMAEAQPQQEAHQSWENMYPGWRFDYVANEWKLIEGWSTVQEQHLVREEEDVSFSQPSPSTGLVSMPLSSFWQNAEQEHRQTLASDESFPPATSYDQQFAAGNPSHEQQANWEQQYPGWYYDPQSQQWYQIADSQSWASSQHPKVDASQGEGLVQNAQSSRGGWIDQQVQPQYQSEVNQSIYTLETSHSLYGSGGGADTRTLTRGMSFNSWAEPPTGGSLYGQQGMDNTQQHMDITQEAGSVNSWTGFQGADRTVPNHTYQAVPDPINQSYQDFTQADKPSFFGNSQVLFQSYPDSTAGVGGERSSAGRPSHALVAFGFGGKLVTMKAPQFRTAEPLILHDLNRLVSSTEHPSDVSTYFSSLNRHGLSGPLHGATSKDVLKWVDERIENCGKEDCQGMSSESVHLLWGVLKIACQNYGKLRSVAGSAGIKSQTEEGPEVALGRLLAAAKSHSHWNQGLATSTDLLHSVPTGHQLQAAVNEVRSMLMDGKMKEALQFAQQGQLWGLALVLAWQLGEKVYADTVLQMAQQQFSPGSPMRTLLLLFAGQASELFKAQSLPLSVGTYGPIFSAASNAQDSAGGMLRDWLGNLSIIAANPTKGDEQVITHLGDSLWKDQGEVAGAHTCYLVADTTFESFSKEARLCLVGADHFKFQRTFATPQAIQRTELYEYAKTLGNPQYVLFPFQPFKLLYAHMLAEAGRITEASRYCQMVIKNLKSGRGSEIEFCKQSAIGLEERLRLHSQGGYSLNFSTGKLVGKVMGTIDSTIHKIIGGPPSLPQQPSPAFGNSQDWYANDKNAGSSTKAAPMIPSASNNNLFSGNSQVDVPTRSVSEPNLIRSSSQDPNATSSETSSATPSQLKSAGSNGGGGYLGRFGSQIFAKAMGLVRHNKEAKLGDENKFYYDEKLKRWVEAGAEQSTQEAVLAPPPIMASFNSSSGSPSDAKSGGDSQGRSASVSSSADLPPIPPSVNQFSARGRLHGVRSRYVDTFNKGNVQVAAKSSQSPLVPGAAGGWGVASSPSQFFAPVSVTAVTNGSADMLANGHKNDGSPEFLKPASDHTKGGYAQVENEPLLPKNLNTSFMDVPVIQKHSSTGNMALLTDNELTPVKSDTPYLANMARAVSWSGDSPTPFHQCNLSNGYESGQMQAVAAESMLSGSLQGAAFGEMQEVEL
ncbi:hypothetical protein GOP47_0019933 [Adiantum capillus-veneris]|uniref:Protein transport protein sec16 n=1 Tax=Adiantum capillus-veneris TaxID=13818 RepID=A0A9D4UCZ5_ADICA|nr:hypothetical protein GOP47_0019933 [Adiantum capillus-veneris]